MAYKNISCNLATNVNFLFLMIKDRDTRKQYVFETKKLLGSIAHFDEHMY
jgi:hypothetical protein